ncbi:WD40 repeat domain-containing serine/threonine protein kinase [Streptomyces sp. UC1A3]
MGSALTQDDPERIGGYWLAARLGAGGQGVVYEAYDASGARYALKTLHREADPVLRDRFAREAEAARRVAAFCTARILLARVDDDVPYLVSEYVPGPTLAAEVRAKGALGQDAVLRLATGVATALAAIHQAGVLHRDLKPGNVLLGPDGPRIIDFGIARAPDMSLTATGAIMGTFGYMAPEVLAGQRATQASDVFAWAAVVLYAATATEPFRGENIAEVAHRTATVDPDLGVLPPEIRPLMAAALAKDPQHRPTASDLLLGLVGAPVKAADPRAALMEAGARKAAAPAADTAPADGGTSPGTGAGHTVVEAPLGERAEAAFQALAPTAQLAAHALLLRLTVPGSAADGSQDSVRTAGPAELLSDRPESERLGITAAVQGLAAAGVLLTDADGSVRPASAALLPAWRRLHAWTDTDRPGIDRLQRIGAAARLWQAHGERAEDLLRGTELRGCLDWLPTAPYHLRPNPLELRFLTAGRTAAARTARRRRQLLAGLAGTTVLALVAGGVAWTQNREAEQRRSQATARAVARTAEALPGTEPEAAMLLGLASWRIAEVPEARAALIAAAVQPERSVVDIAGLEGTPEVMSPDGRRLVTVSPQGVRFWDVSKGAAGSAKPLATLSPKDYRLDRITDSAHAPAFSPDGKLMLLRGEDGSFRIVNTEDGTAAAPPIEAPDYQGWEGVSNSGHVLLTQAGTQGTVFDRSGRRGASQPTRTLDFQYAVTPDGTRFVSCVGQRVQVRPVDFGAPVIDEPAPDPTPEAPASAASASARTAATWPSSKGSSRTCTT